jgi:hypothetical protein
LEPAALTCEPLSRGDQVTLGGSQPARIISGY